MNATRRRPVEARGRVWERRQEGERKAVCESMMGAYSHQCQLISSRPQGDLAVLSSHSELHIRRDRGPWGSKAVPKVRWRRCTSGQLGRQKLRAAHSGGPKPWQKSAREEERRGGQERLNERRSESLGSTSAWVVWVLLSLGFILSSFSQAFVHP